MRISWTLFSPKDSPEENREDIISPSDPHQPFKRMWRLWTAIWLALYVLFAIVLLIVLVVAESPWWIFLLSLPLSLPILMIFSLLSGFAFAVLQWLYFTPIDRGVAISLEKEKE